MEHDIVKAIDFSKELTDELGNILPEADVADIKFSLATAYAMQGKDIATAQATLKECLDIAPAHMKGFILNNLGMTYFYNFVAMSSEISDP